MKRSDIAACGTILNGRVNLHFPRLAEHLNTADPALEAWRGRAAAGYTVSFGGDSVHGGTAAIKALWAPTWREAQTQTFAECSRCA